MKLTKRWLIKHKACEEGIEAFVNQKETDLIKILKVLIKSDEIEKLEWANWLIVRFFRNKKQKIQHAIYGATLILPAFEKQYPKDLTPRKAIEAAKNYLRYPNENNKDICHKAAQNIYAAFDNYNNYTTYCADIADIVADNTCADNIADGYAYDAIFLVIDDKVLIKKILKNGIKLLLE